jgi:hypothetical protein
MMKTTPDKYSLVLIGRYPGRDQGVAQMLAKEFGRDKAWGLQIVASSPIVVLDKLNHEQAKAIHDVLADVQDAGCLFEIKQAVEEGTAVVQWEEAPKIRGKWVTLYGPYQR